MAADCSVGVDTAAGPCPAVGGAVGVGDLAAVDVPVVMASGAGVAIGFPVVAMDDPAHPNKPNPTATATHLSMDSQRPTAIYRVHLF